MNTIAVLALCLLAFAVSAQRHGGDLIGFSNCPSYFCQNGQCGRYSQFSRYYGRQCSCPCYGFGGGSGGSGITSCPRYFCSNGQCGQYNTYSQHRYRQCRCDCYGYSGYSGIIQN
ncbi:hypothetical protein ACJMK2_020770 [Sinanodonta woodiana]|uniref:Uncharacterized protein n=1 Tax=Sinanodonta woodiana TaxID=1069815 RepID=A0ABD3U035_SINWO